MNTAIHQVFDAAQVELTLCEAVEHCTDTLLNASAHFQSLYTGDAVEEGQVTRLNEVEEPMIVAAIGFVGEVNGVAYLYFGQALAAHIAAQMLGMDAESFAENPDVLNDSIGEIANVVIGSYKNNLCDLGFECRLTIPSIVRGSAFCIETSAEMERFFACFDLFDQTLVIDLIVQPH